MRYIYQADQVVEFEDGKPVPMYPANPGVKVLRWRWLAEGPWWYFETEKPLAGATAAPATYLSGEPLDTPTTIPWREPEAEVKP